MAERPRVVLVVGDGDLSDETERALEADRAHLRFPDGGLEPARLDALAG